MFPAKLAAKLAGVTPAQLTGWRRNGMLVPEYGEGSSYLYSMRDIIALRAFARLRAELSLQKIRRSLDNMDLLQMREHPSAYVFGTDGVNVFVQAKDNHAVNLDELPGQATVFTFEEVTQKFTNFKGEEVVDLWNPSEHLTVDPNRLGGWPTIAGTRIPYDTICQAIDGITVTIKDIEDYYPGVSSEAAQDAINFDAEVNAAA